MAQQPEPGDWLQGKPRAWWRYVFPTPDVILATIVQIRSTDDPEPQPWRQQIGELLEGVVMLRAASQVRDKRAAEKLRQEAINTISHGAKALTR